MAPQKPKADEEKQEWDRQLRETSRSYELFSVYRNLGPQRSLAKARESSSGMPSIPRLKVLSVRWNWVDRARKYDDYLEYQDRLQQEKERREMHKRHSRIAMLGQNIAVKGLEGLLGKVQANEVDVAPGDLVRLVDTSVKVERISRGEPASGPVNGAIEGASSMTAIAITVRYEQPRQLPASEAPTITIQRSGNNGDGA